MPGQGHVPGGFSSFFSYWIVPTCNTISTNIAVDSVPSHMVHEYVRIIHTHMYVFIHVLHSPFKLSHVHNIVHRSVPDLHCRIHTIQYCLASHQVVDCGPCEHLVATQIANLLSTQPWPRQHRSNVMFVTHHAQHHLHS